MSKPDNIEDKLREIAEGLIIIAGSPFTTPQAAEAEVDKFIAQIKTVFKDEGYAQDTYSGSGRAYTTDHKELMKGSEWLERFEKELPLYDHEIDGLKHKVGTPYTREHVLEAARRASGVK